MILFCGIAGLCLWGLFNLLDNLKQPELLRTAKVVVVKGCDSTASAEALQVCPQLFCQKALLESKLVPLKTRFTMTLDKSDAKTRVVGGATGDGRSFACLLEGNTVTASRLLTEQEISALDSQPGNWTL
ncbi:MAG: hypothetical protein ABW106_01235 [Steroidobacteraceae bacterium]